MNMDMRGVLVCTAILISGWDDGLHQDEGLCEASSSCLTLLSSTGALHAG